MGDSAGLIPLALLRDWRSPDRDIHRRLVTTGPQSQQAVMGALGVGKSATRNALGRLMRLGLVETTGRGPGRVRWQATYHPTATVFRDGRTQLRESVWR